MSSTSKSDHSYHLGYLKAKLDMLRFILETDSQYIPPEQTRLIKRILNSDDSGGLYFISGVDFAHPTTHTAD